jgi:hypothetical protein
MDGIQNNSLPQTCFSLLDLQELWNHQEEEKTLLKKQNDILRFKQTGYDRILEQGVFVDTERYIELMKTINQLKSCTTCEYNLPDNILRCQYNDPSSDISCSRGPLKGKSDLWRIKKCLIKD